MQELIASNRGVFRCRECDEDFTSQRLFAWHVGAEHLKVLRHLSAEARAEVEAMMKEEGKKKRRVTSGGKVAQI